MIESLREWRRVDVMVRRVRVDFAHQVRDVVGLRSPTAERITES